MADDVVYYEATMDDFRDAWVDTRAHSIQQVPLAQAEYDRVLAAHDEAVRQDLRERIVFEYIDTDDLARVITDYLLNYTLPANYGPPLADEDHVDVADRCGPLIAEAVKAHLLKEDA